VPDRALLLPAVSLPWSSASLGAGGHWKELQNEWRRKCRRRRYGGSCHSYIEKGGWAAFPGSASPFGVGKACASAFAVSFDGVGVAHQ
jgi:hypothetical protein